MSRTHYVLAGAALVLLAAFGVGIGLVPIQASSGHWPATAWVLDWVKRRSVRFYSRSIEAPALDHPVLVTRGAAHYERNCRSCHGSPAAARPPLVMKMTPHPPFLPERVPRWDNSELFQIVKHGIKFTGMPAWPAPKRNDEIWAVVAFLRALPGMPAEEYWRLAVGSPEHPGAAAPVVALCAACHGRDGAGRDGGGFPVLAGQTAAYLRQSLEAYAGGRRHSGVMGPIAAALDESTRELVVDYYSQQPRPVTRGAAGDVASGEAIARRGLPQQRVPACIECHAPEVTTRGPEHPILDGQHAEYLLLQLQLFTDDSRGGSGLAEVMRPIAARLTPEQQRDVAAYFANRRPEPP